MNTLKMLQASSYTLALTLLAAADPAAQSAQDGGPGVGTLPTLSGAAVSAPGEPSASALGYDGPGAYGVQPTFEGDLVHAGLPSRRSGACAQLLIARPDAPVVAWTVAPAQISVPSGERVLLEISLAQPHLVLWTGAREVELGPFHSRAEFRAASAGLQLVQVELTTPDGKSLGISKLVIEVTGPGAGSARLLGIDPIPGLPSDACRISAVQIVPGITSTFIAVIEVCNTGASETALSFELAMSAPAGKAWSASTPATTPVLAPGESTTVYVAFALLDTDAGTEPADGHATLSLLAFGRHGVADALGTLFGGARSPACTAELIDVACECNGN